MLSWAHFVGSLSSRSGMEMVDVFRTKSKNSELFCPFDWRICPLQKDC